MMGVPPSGVAKEASTLVSGLGLPRTRIGVEVTTPLGAELFVVAAVIDVVNAVNLAESISGVKLFN